MSPDPRLASPRLVAAFRGNFGPRCNVSVDTVVIHTTEATRESAVAWFSMDHAPFKSPPSSAHYVIGKGGDVTQCVAEGDAAYHAGNWPVNARSVGIECEGHCADPTMWTDTLLGALVELCADIARRHGVPVLRTSAGPGFCGHADVPDPYHPGRKGGAGGHTDPGAGFPWISFLDRLDAALRPASVSLPVA